jgi:hypothetical protein
MSLFVWRAVKDKDTALYPTFISPVMNYFFYPGGLDGARVAG